MQCLLRLTQANIKTQEQLRDLQQKLEKDRAMQLQSQRSEYETKLSDQLNILLKTQQELQSKNSECNQTNDRLIQTTGELEVCTQFLCK